MKKLSFVTLVLGIAFTNLATGADPSEIQKDIVYATVDKSELKLDLIQPPTGDGPFPLIIWIHPGAWRMLDRSFYHGPMKTFAPLGYVSASLEYRFAPRYQHPAQLDDVRTALEFLRKNAKTYNIDTDRIAVAGCSAGGQLGLLLGFMKTNGKASGVKAVVNFNGPTDFRKWTAPQKGEDLFRPGFEAELHGWLKDYLGTTDRNAKIMAEASPVTYVAKDNPPVLTIHGSADGTVPVSQAVLLHEALRKAGATETLVVIPGAKHNYHAYRPMQEFLAKELRKK